MGCLRLALSMEQWELYKPSATEQEAHQTCPLLSWSTLTDTLAPPSLTALCPSFLFAAAGPPQEASAHICSSPSSWHGQSLYIHKSQGLTLNNDVGKKEFSQASRLWPTLEFVSSKTVHMCSKGVCVHVGLGVVGCACGFISLTCILRFSQTMHVTS